MYHLHHVIPKRRSSCIHTLEDRNQILLADICVSEGCPSRDDVRGRPELESVIARPTPSRYDFYEDEDLGVEHADAEPKAMASATIKHDLTNASSVTPQPNRGIRPGAVYEHINRNQAHKILVPCISLKARVSCYAPTVLRMTGNPLITIRPSP